MNTAFPSASRLHLGVSYYPEHWPEERWLEDIRLMQEAGMSVVRMGEFAWSSFEPSAGEFRLDWLQRVISQLASSGIVSVLGTPTAGPPAWLAAQHPDFLAVDEYGRRAQIGNRCHYCVNSPEFHAAVQRIVKALAKRFGSNPNVIGWQLDNEYHRVCFCDRCRRLFQDFLQTRYGSLDALNEHWSTSYWSQTYSAWQQIPIPIGPHNPGLMLEFKHFITESYRNFQRLQVDNLRPYLPERVWITHNFMRWFDGYDHYTMSEDLDIASWDWYVGMGHHDYLTSGVLHDLVRGFKQKNFWLIETQPGSINWKPINTTLNRGEARTMAWHAVAHGADAILYWQWRSALGGQEQLHGTLVDQSGRTRPFYEEAQQLGRDFATISPILVGSEIKASVAMLNDYDSLWSIKWQPHHRDFDYEKHFTHYYRPLALLNVPVDVVSANGLMGIENLTSYKLVIAPALSIQNQTMVEALQAYVAQGGHLVLTIRSGMKDQYNALLPQRQPGGLSEMAGVEVEDYYALQDSVPVTASWFEGKSDLWAERLALTGKKNAQVIARYDKSNGWLDDQIAISMNEYGDGLVYYVGTYLDEPAQQALLTQVLETAKVTTYATAPGIEICKRVQPGGGEVYIVINHNPTECAIHMPWSSFEHLSGVPLAADFNLAAYSVAVLTPDEKRM
ncbi:MAG TPA: beta-galactosidase [Anaerolineales bacterium]|nr:beta-galactosidase [Anaerolineales bacterium]